MAYAKKTGLFFGIGFLLFVVLFSFPKSVEAANRLDFTASSTNITAGTNVTLDWEAIGFDWNTCAGGGGTFAGSKGIMDSEIVTPATTTTYTLSCNFFTDTPRVIFKSITVTVSAAPVPPPAPPAPPAAPAATASLTLNGIAGGVTISPGQSVVVRWSSSGATSCTASSSDSAFNGPQGTSGEVTVSPATTTSYSVYCTDASGTNGAPVSRTVTVTGDVPVIDLRVNPSLINAGDSTTLTWSVTNAQSCVASSTDGFWSGAVSNIGGSSVFFPGATVSYNLVCTSASGGVTSEIREVTVSSASCNNGTIEAGEACDNGLGDGGVDNGACPAVCSLTCTLNNCAAGTGSTVCTDPTATCKSGCSGSETRVGTCGGTNVCCKAVVSAPVNGTIDVINPVAFDTVQGSLDPILGTLQAIIAIIAIIFLVIGGILYMTAAGDEGRVKTAKGVITAAMIGLALGVAAPSFLKQIGDILGWGAIPGPVAGRSFLEIATSVLNFLLSVTGIIGIIMLVVGGLMYMTSAGDEGRIDTGKKIVQYSIIGIAISLGALVIVTQLARFFS